MPSTPGLRRAILIAFVLVAALSGCALPFGRSGAPTPFALPTANPTPTEPAQRSLTVCLGAEPNTLYPLGSPNAAARSVLAAIYDGPLDTLSYDYQPVMLQKLPSLADGDVQIVPAEVRAGDTVVDANGTAVMLAAGQRMRPASCRGDDCIVTYDGSSTLQMDQMIVTFTMRPDLTWSDGTPLTADDSVYAYQIDLETAPVGSRFLLDRTQVYEAADAASTQWWGIPGFLDPSFMTNFWSPAPKHAWSTFLPAELAQIDIASRSPMGWGPYQLEEWAAADHIKLVKNPSYFRLAEGYPKFDEVIFRFVTDPNAAISELTAGRCDILDPSVRLDGQMALLSQLEQAGTARVSIAPGMAIEWLGIGIVPGAYDDGISLARNDRPDLLADARTRQALALCADRQQAVDTVLFGRSTVPLAFVPIDHPLYNGNVPAYKHDTAAGIALLEQVGWRDLDGDPTTPRVASGVANVPAGTPLSLNYYTTPALQRRQVADILSQSMRACGVGVSVQFFSQDDLYAPGPEGLLFGRRFDLIEYAMSTDEVVPPCSWFMSGDIPNAANLWIGTNVTGFKDPEFDAACHSAALALPGESRYDEAYGEAQMLFASALPAIPLYHRLKVAAASADVCHFDLDPSANPMWNIEAFDMGQGCQQ
jgi:peptide/nickel transport system substrate-binding protein